MRTENYRRKKRLGDLLVEVGIISEEQLGNALDMQKGEKRTVIIPPSLGYGDNGVGDIIHPWSYLIFDIELIDFE